MTGAEVKHNKAADKAAARKTVFTCSSDAVGEFRAELKTIGGRPDQLEVSKSLDGGITWMPVSLRLDGQSAILNMLRSHWPPRIIEEFAVRDGALVLKFRDIWVPEQNVAIRALDQESEWLASFNLSKNKWSIKRLRYLNL